MGSTGQYNHYVDFDVYAKWFKRYEEESEKDTAVSLQSVNDYIKFKVIHGFAFGTGNSIDICHPAAVNWFMGSLRLSQVVKDFNRNAVILQTQNERLYFGSPSVSRKRMRCKSILMNKSVKDFSIFISSLEEKVFKSSISTLNQENRQMLGMILRIINQGVSAISLSMLNAYLQVRSGECNEFSFDGSTEMKYIFRADDSIAKGSTQIDIMCGDEKVQLSRREYVTVQKLDENSLMNPDIFGGERWLISILLSKFGTEESIDWRLHFSVTKMEKDSSEMSVPLRMRYCQSAASAGSSEFELSSQRQSLTDESSVSSSLLSVLKSPLRSILRSSASSKSRNNSWRDKDFSDEDGKSTTVDPTPVRVINNWVVWHQHEKDNDNRRNISLERVQSYIYFKLVHDLSTSSDNSIHIKDQVPIDYFLGDFMYNRVLEGFSKCIIVLLMNDHKFCFGKKIIQSNNPTKSIVEIDGSGTDFDSFITTLEKKVFKCKSCDLDERGRCILNMILRLISQDESAIAPKLLCGIRKERLVGSMMITQLFQENELPWVEIICEEDNVNVYRQEMVMLCVSDQESKLLGGVEDVESWKMITSITQMCFTKSVDWTLHFSVMREDEMSNLGSLMCSLSLYSDSISEKTTEIGSISQNSLNILSIDNERESLSQRASNIASINDNDDDKTKTKSRKILQNEVKEQGEANTNHNEK